MHGIHTVLAQQRRPTDSRSPARIDRTAARKSSATPTIPREYIKHRSQHETVLTVSVPSARARRYGRSRCSARCKPQAGKVSGQEHHKNTSYTTRAFINKQHSASHERSARTAAPTDSRAPARIDRTATASATHSVTASETASRTHCDASASHWHTTFNMHSMLIPGCKCSCANSVL